LAIGGNLDGKYVYIKKQRTNLDYLEYLSSVLGAAFIQVQRLDVLVAEKLDLNVLIAPLGAFEPFKKTASTACSGGGWVA